jgi:predicted acetyltransferase
MTVEVRPLADDEVRTAHTLFRASLHRGPMSDEQWETFVHSFEPGRTHGAFDGGRMVGTALAWSSDLRVPGGAVLPMAAVTRVGVRADFRRRGVLRELMGVQLADFARRGEVFAGLHASEAGIYGRFGYGVATRSQRMAAKGARLRPLVPRGGAVRVVDAGDKVIFDLYAAAGRSGVGTIARPATMWKNYERAWAIKENLVTAVHTGPGGDDGFVTWRPVEVEGFEQHVLQVEDFVAADAEAAYALWDFLFSIDLVERVRVWQRPVDEALQAAVVDPRTVSVEGVEDDLWVRVVDVPAALAARTYRAGDPVVVEVLDPLLAANSGRYLIGPGGVERTGAPAAVAVDVEVLAMVYLGAWSWSALAAAGRVQVGDPDAPAALDRLFAVDRAPFTGTYY